MTPELSDRERILLTIIGEISSAAIFRRNVHVYRESELDGSHFVHFAHYRKPLPGDLVMARSRQNHPWVFSFYVSPLPSNIGGAVVRAIGSDVLCNYSNESFIPVVGLSAIDLLEGDRRLVYCKVLKAFRRGDEYLHRFGGLRYEGEEMVIVVREIFHGMGQPSQPYEIRMPWSKRTSIKAILNAMRAGGYGKKSFRPEVAA